MMLPATFEQSANAESPISVTLSPMEIIPLSSVHLKNAYGPMVLTLLGMTKEPVMWHPVKLPLQIVSSESGKLNSPNN